MQPIIIYLDSDQAKALLKFAISNGRTPQEEAKVWIIDVLEENGYLQASAPDPTSEQSF